MKNSKRSLSMQERSGATKSFEKACSVKSYWRRNVFRILFMGLEKLLMLFQLFRAIQEFFKR